VPDKKRVLSGMRPTGRLHIGHYFGALKNWIKLQDEADAGGNFTYECFFFVADWHALTTDYADASQVAANTIEIGTDWLAAGLDPEKCTLFIQSQVPEHAELHLLLSMVTPLGWLERVPTYKEQLDQITDKDLHTYGFLGYPLLQTADIVIYDANFVPVGEDQVPHVEISREVVRRFNASFARVDESARKLSLDHRLSLLANQGLQVEQILREPDVLLTETPRLPGTDGRKMSKSYDNYISLSESDDSIRAKTKVMMTDPARKRRTDKGNPDVCPVFSWHKLFSDPKTIAWSDHGCRTAEIGCIECKAAMADGLIRWIEPVRARRQEYEAQPGRVLEILDAGSKKARAGAQATMARVREAVFGWQEERRKISSPARAGKPGVA
jgi:tryptophanyl-tRNA synthetase